MPTPEKTGYTFGGWYCGETLIENGSAVAITEDSVFTAAWTANTYTVTFHNTTLYSLVKKATDTFTYDVEKELVCDAFTTKGNIALVGWSTTSGGEVVYECNQLVMNLTAEPNGNVDLYAVWEPIITTEEIAEPETEASAFSLEEVTEETAEEPTETEEPVLVTTVYCKTYTYDIAGNRISFTLEKSGETVHNIVYTYDNFNRLATVSENGTVEAAYTYDTNGNRKSVTYGNGTAEIYEYNLANWVTKLYNKKGNGGVISNYSYEYYVSGNQKSKTESTGAVTTYIYDDLGRLTSESESDGTILSYAYDAAGNRARLTATGIESYVTDYTYDSANRLLTETKTVDGAEETTTYTYDANGNTLTVTAPESLQLNTYNLFNQLTATNINGNSSEYTYNTAGIRTAKTVDKLTTVFLLDGGNVVGEVQNDTVKATYLRGANLISRESTTAKQYYVFNAHGDVTALIGTDGSINKRYDYDAFGNEKEPTESDYNPFRYCGEYFDKETGTYYLRARYYDPSIGRFTQQDTHWNTANMIYGDNPNKINEREDALGLKTYTYAPSIGSIMQSGNLYVYGINNPVSYKDFSGNFAITASVVIATAFKYVVIPFAIGWGSQFIYDLIMYVPSGQEDFGAYMYDTRFQRILSGVSCVIAGPCAGPGRIAGVCFFETYVSSVYIEATDGSVTPEQFRSAFISSYIFNLSWGLSTNAILKDNGTNGIINVNTINGTEYLLTLDDASSSLGIINSNILDDAYNFANELSTVNSFSSTVTWTAGFRNPINIKNYRSEFHVL